MTRAERKAECVAQLPPEMRALLDRQLAAGNSLDDVEVDAASGHVYLVMDHPFRDRPDPPPAGVLYRESTGRDPVLFEYHTPDERWSLMTAKLLPMKPQPLPRPPARVVEPAEAVPERGNAPEAVAVPPAPAVAIPTPPLLPPLPAPELGAAANRFLTSMSMTFDVWHDGTGYDLAALAAVPPEEVGAVAAVLLARRPVAWRDVEALARIDAPAARAAVAAAVTDADPEVRRVTRASLPAEATAALDPAEREARLLRALGSDDLYGGLSQAIDEAAEFHPPAVEDALIGGALSRPGPAAVHFAALLYYIHGKSAEPFDWGHRPFFLRFDGSDGRASHLAAFRELCATLGVDPAAHGDRG